MIKISDTLSNLKREFIPIEEKTVKMYVCGPTVYNYVHIGNARPAIVFDSFRRFLEYSGYKVTYVLNFTDIDDKIINRMNDESWDFKIITSTFIREYLKDMRALGVRDANFYPKTSDYIPETVNFIDKLIRKGNAYVSEGEVFFDVSSFREYGKLSNRKVEDMLAGARIEIDEKKRNPADFTLWKPAKDGEPYWDSPWGKGRPGWHIECSVMSSEILGENFDIHAGGNDLIFPHHENEIAQSEACSGKCFANYWMHNGMLQMGGRKMAKSVGNIISVREAVNKYGKDAIRLFMFSTHFRSPIDYSEERFSEWAKGAQKISSFLSSIEEKYSGEIPVVKSSSEWMKQIRKRFVEYLEDDFNTSKVVAMLFEIVKELTTSAESPEKEVEAYYLIREEFSDVLGLFNGDCGSKHDEYDSNIEEGLMRTLIDVRKSLREKKIFDVSDKIRDDLNSLGIVLKDGPEGTSWEKI